MSIGIRQDDTLETWLTSCAHTISQRALTALAAAGALLVSAAWIWRSAGTWPLTVVGVCGAAFGVWALADQRLEAMQVFASDRTNRLRRVGWRTARRLAAVVGVLSGAGLLMSLPIFVLGRWIS